jgi:hypothetical protein
LIEMVPLSAHMIVPVLKLPVPSTLSSQWRWRIAQCHRHDAGPDAMVDPWRNRA